MATANADEEVDVLICGAGPVGLLIAYCLARYGISTYVIEQHERARQTRYGRAAMIAPRTLEMLDQLDLADSLGQIGFVVRGQVSYKNGEKADSITAASSNITDTFFDYLLLCRQRYTEDVIRDGYRRCSDRSVNYGARLTGFSVLRDNGNRSVRSSIENRDGTRTEIHSKYLIGADGGRSKVRELAEIRFEGESSSRFWVRIDGIVETNMPEARRGLCGIESPSHGSILWACLDHGTTRVGFALPKGLKERLGADITREDVILEAKKALQPFTLEFKTVDWWTVYSIGQRLAAEYRWNERVFLAGDAAHTHSSGAAQGMNTGIHDAVNLSWKLAGCISGWLTESVLDTYASERRPIAQKIIDQDKIISVLTGGEIPEEYKNEADLDPHKLLTDTYKKNASLNTGLGVAYPPDDVTVVSSKVLDNSRVTPGERVPDVLLQRPGLHIPVRLLSIMKNHCKFSIISICGDPSRTSASIKRWRQSVDDMGNFSLRSDRVMVHSTIIMGHNDAGSPAERLGVDSFGQIFYDVDGSAHARFGVLPDKGAVFVVRPDGTIGTICDLGDGDSVLRYFSRFTGAPKHEPVHTHQARDDYEVSGEIDIDAEVNLEDRSRGNYETS